MQFYLVLFSYWQYGHKPLRENIHLRRREEFDNYKHAILSRPKAVATMVMGSTKLPFVNFRKKTKRWTVTKIAQLRDSHRMTLKSKGDLRCMILQNLIL